MDTNEPQRTEGSGLKSYVCPHCYEETYVPQISTGWDGTPIKSAVSGSYGVRMICGSCGRFSVTQWKTKEQWLSDGLDIQILTSRRIA